MYNMFKEYTIPHLAASPRYISMAGTLSLAELFWKKPTDILNHWNNQPTVYLVPGFSRSYKTMERLWEKIWAIMNVKYVPIIRGDWKEWTLAWLWEKVNKKIQPSENGVIVVWHSAGGVVWARELSTNSSIDRVVQISSPNQWSPLFSPFRKRIPTAEEFASGNHYAWIDLSNIGSRITSIVTLDDQMVPPESQVMEGSRTIELQTDHFGPIMEEIWMNEVIKAIISSSHDRDRHTPS